MQTIGRLQRGTPGSLEFAQYGFTGLNIKDVPQEIADTELVQALNGYLTTSRGFQMRNGMTTYGTAVTASGAVKGLARFFQQIDNGQTVTTKVLLAQVADTLYDADTQTSIGSLGSSTTPMTWTRAQDPNDPNFSAPATPTLSAIAGTSTGYTAYVVLTYVTPSGESTVSSEASQTVTTSQQVHVASPAAATYATSYNVYAGTSSGGPYYLQNSTPVAIGTAFTVPGTLLSVTSPPTANTARGLTDVIVICSGSGGPYVYDGTNLYAPSGWSAAAGAQWCALVNGVVWFGGIASTPRTIYGTGDGVDASFESLPSYNTFVMSDPVSGLCALGTGATASLVIGMNSGVSTLSGTGPNNYTLQDVPSFNDGVTAGRTMIYEAGIAYWLGRQAVYAFDGFSPPVQISQKVEPWILNSSYVAGYPVSATRSLSFAFIYNNKLFIGYPSGSGQSVPNAILVYDLIVRGWTVLQTTPGLYCAAMLDAPSDPSPATVVVGTTASTALIYNWDVAPGFGNVATDAGIAITASFQTKYYKIGVPGTNKAVTRIYPELYLSGIIVGNVSIQTDYGSTITQAALNQAAQAGAQFDVSNWDQGFFTGGNYWVAFNAPASRIDFDSIQAEAFSFIISTSGGSSPWIVAGFTGVYRQLGRT